MLSDRGAASALLPEGIAMATPTTTADVRIALRRRSALSRWAMRDPRAQRCPRAAENGVDARSGPGFRPRSVEGYRPGSCSPARGRSRQLSASLVGLSAVAPLVGCASFADPESQDATAAVQVSAFNERIVAAPLEVTLSSSEYYGVVVAAGEDDADLVWIAVDGETLLHELDRRLSSRSVVTVSRPATELTPVDLSEAALVSTITR